MQKSFWGPSTWFMIHSIATGYRPESKFSVKQFFNSLPTLLPCEFCRNNLIGEYAKLPPLDSALSNSTDLFSWTYSLHDMVNKKLMKKASPSFASIESYYVSQHGNNNYWGPAFWRVIHSFSATYKPSPKARQAYIQFIHSLIGITPCSVCRDNFEQALKQIPLTEEYLQDGNRLFLWSFLLHDLINKKLGKHSPSFESIKKEYFNDKVCGNCGN